VTKRYLFLIILEVVSNLEENVACIKYLSNIFFLQRHKEHSLKLSSSKTHGRRAYFANIHIHKVTTEYHEAVTQTKPKKSKITR
jgi:hypothetical protein